MTIRCKTVEYVFATNASSISAGTKRTLSTVTIYLPESSKTFRSVTLEMGCTDHVTTASSATNFAMEITLGAASADSSSVADTVTNSGESSVYHISRDVTSYFTSNWGGGTSQTCTTAITVSTNATNNHWAKLRITYEYDDTSSIHAHTIWVPLELTRTLLTNGYQTVGGSAAIPAIKGSQTILPESSIAIRQVWVELLGNQATSDATDFDLGVKLTTDGTEQTALYHVEAALATPGWLHTIWDITAAGLAAAQTFEAKSSVTNRVANLCGWVGITYEFTASATTNVWNSLILPAFDESDQHGSTTSSNKTQHVKKFWIAEPGTILTKPSQAFAFYGDTGEASAISLWVHPQVARSFTNTATLSSMVLGQRIDNGGTSAAGVTFQRGLNEVRVFDFCNSASPGAYSGVNGFMIVNYISEKATAGVGAHNHSVHFALGWYKADAPILEYSSDTVAPKTPTIPETDYFLNAVALQATWLTQADKTQQAIRIQAQRAGSEGPAGDGAGWVNIYHGALGIANPITGSSENWLRWTTADATRLFTRWTGDVDTTRMNLETARRWQFLTHGGTWVGSIGLFVTYHSITATAQGTVRGTAGDGSGLTVNISRSATGEKVLTAATTTGGAYAATWYDDTEALVADVYEDATHMGRSAPFYAGE